MLERRLLKHFFGLSRLVLVHSYVTIQSFINLADESPQ